MKLVTMAHVYFSDADINTALADFIEKQAIDSDDPELKRISKHMIEKSFMWDTDNEGIVVILSDDYDCKEIPSDSCEPK